MGPARSGAADAPLRTHLFGVPVDAVTAETAMSRVRTAGAADGGRPLLVFTPNPEAVMQARRRPEYARVLAAADLALPDGVGVVWAARRAGLAVAGRVPGVDFMGELLGEAAAAGWPVYFLGAEPGVAGQAARRAAERHPGLRVAGSRDGFFAPERDGEVAAAVASSGAAVLLAGMGTGRQERFLYEQRSNLGGVRIAMAVGGSFDVLAGRVRRAPELVRRAGLEWLWRLASQPRRLRRQLALPRFVVAVLAAGPAARKR